MTAFEAVGRGSIPRWGNQIQQGPRSVRDSTRLCEGRRPGSTPGEDILRYYYGAGARWQGDCLQSSFKWVRLPPASVIVNESTSGRRLTNDSNIGS